MEDLTTITGRIIPGLLVAQLKLLIKSLNESIRPGPQLKLSGNKPELIQRLVIYITHCHQNGDQTIIRQIRHCIAAFNQGEVTTIATPMQHHSINSSLNNISGSSSSSSSSNSGGIFRITSQASMHNQQKGPTMHTFPGMIQQRPVTSHIMQQPQHMQYQHHRASQVFKSSPFYKDVQTLTPPKLCQEAKDRTLSIGMSFNIAPMLATQLKKDPEYQLMVFCTWADVQPTNAPLLMEFPHVCEIKVNGKVLEAYSMNLRGMKNKPGTVAPANITKLCRLDSADQNRIEFIYANSTKRYYTSVHVVKRTSVETIVAGIEQGKFLSKEKMLLMIAERNKDEDIMATSSTLSLKCPLGFQRIKIPCRSSYCQHLQCFDAITFFDLNEQTPTWTCPVCSRIMHSWEEIVIDGYFKDLLKSTPSSLESITVQADGSWELPSATSTSTSQSEPIKPPSPKKKAIPSGSSVWVIDEDESDDDADEIEELPAPAKPEKAVEVIDLISDSEDDVEESTTEPQKDHDGDTSMQDVSTILQNIGNTAGSSLPVKTEVLDKPTPTESNQSTQVPIPPIEVHGSIAGTANASRSTSSEPSPIEPVRMGGLAEYRRAPPPISPSSNSATPGNLGFSDEDSFMNALLQPGRKRQYDDTADIENHNSMAYETRQRIAQMDIRSNPSSERGSVSAMHSPDAIRRSTSSPTPVPTFHDFDRRFTDHNRHIEEPALRSRREQMMNRYYENGSQHPTGPGGIPVSSASSSTSGHTSFTPPRHISHGAINRNARGGTMSPPVHHGYSNASPHHHHSSSRSTHSPGPDYYGSLTRAPSSGSLSSTINLAPRPHSMASDRPFSFNSTSSPAFNGSSSSAWTQDDYSNGGHDRNNRSWGGGDQRSSGLYSNSPRLNHGHHSPRRSGEELRVSSGSRPGSPGHFSAASSSSNKYPSYQPSSSSFHGQHSSQHRRHRSGDDMVEFRQREEWRENSHHRPSYSVGEDERYGHGSHHQQHVYNPNISNGGHHGSLSQQNGLEGSSGGRGLAQFEERPRNEGSMSSGSRDDDAPIYVHNGLRGARAR
ncbi:SUMO ligase siz1 [Entomortierella beljakovae]|nr:SUMO ligase siz1 [Entomortierella beljakovae]